MVRRIVLGLRRVGETKPMNKAALHAPPPRDGQVLRTALPDTFDGIRFEIGRMIEYVIDAAKDPVVIDHVQEICSRYRDRANSMGQSEGVDYPDDASLRRMAIEAWCREHYAYVNDPPNIEVLQTPRRMIKQTQVPPDVIRCLMEPFYNGFKEVLPASKVDAYEPPQITAGDCDEGADLELAQCAAAGIKPLYFEFGGHDDTLHHVWGSAFSAGEMVHSDLTEPDYKIGQHSKFPHYENVEIPL
jgi:hypothetical protein